LKVGDGEEGNGEEGVPKGEDGKAAPNGDPNPAEKGDRS